jgi:hypothetical protein
LIKISASGLKIQGRKIAKKLQKMMKKWKLLQKMKKKGTIVLSIEITECSNIIDEYGSRSECFEEIFMTYY